MKHNTKFLGLALLATLLSSCGGSAPTEQATAPAPAAQTAVAVVTDSALIQKIRAQQAAEQQASATLELTQRVTTDGKLAVEVWLDNANKQDITAVRSFLSFNADAVTGDAVIIPSDSPFDLVAPGEKNFDDARGIVQIGLAASELKSVSDARVLIATVLFVDQQQTTSVDFFDPRSGGGTYVLARNAEGEVKNILKSSEAILITQ